MTEPSCNKEEGIIPNTHPPVMDYCFEITIPQPQNDSHVAADNSSSATSPCIPSASQQPDIPVIISRNPTPSSTPTSYDVDLLSYKQMQTLALKLHLPANIKSELLRQLLQAHLKGDEVRVLCIIQEDKRRRLAITQARQAAAAALVENAAISPQPRLKVRRQLREDHRAANHTSPGALSLLQALLLNPPTRQGSQVAEFNTPTPFPLPWIYNKGGLDPNTPTPSAQNPPPYPQNINVSSSQTSQVFIIDPYDEQQPNDSYQQQQYTSSVIQHTNHSSMAAQSGHNLLSTKQAFFRQCHRTWDTQDFQLQQRPAQPAWHPMRQQQQLGASCVSVSQPVFDVHDSSSGHVPRYGAPQQQGPSDRMDTQDRKPPDFGSPSGHTTHNGAQQQNGASCMMPPQKYQRPRIGVPPYLTHHDTQQQQFQLWPPRFLPYPAPRLSVRETLIAPELRSQSTMPPDNLPQPMHFPSTTPEKPQPIYSQSAMPPHNNVARLSQRDAFRAPEYQSRSIIPVRSMSTVSSNEQLPANLSNSTKRSWTNFSGSSVPQEHPPRQKTCTVTSNNFYSQASMSTDPCASGYKYWRPDDVVMSVNPQTTSPSQQITQNHLPPFSLLKPQVKVEHMDVENPEMANMHLISAVASAMSSLPDTAAGMPREQGETLPLSALPNQVTHPTVPAPAGLFQGQEESVTQLQPLSAPPNQVTFPAVPAPAGLLQEEGVTQSQPLSAPPNQVTLATVPAPAGLLQEEGVTQLQPLSAPSNSMDFTTASSVAAVLLQGQEESSTQSQPPSEEPLSNQVALTTATSTMEPTPISHLLTALKAFAAELQNTTKPSKTSTDIISVSIKGESSPNFEITTEPMEHSTNPIRGPPTPLTSPEVKIVTGPSETSNFDKRPTRQSSPEVKIVTELLKTANSVKRPTFQSFPEIEITGIFPTQPPTPSLLTPAPDFIPTALSCPKIENETPGPSSASIGVQFVKRVTRRRATVQKQEISQHQRCKFMLNGCKRYFKTIIPQNKHQVRCIYRLVVCVFCDWQGPIIHFEKHITQAHANLILHGESVTHSVLVQQLRAQSCVHLLQAAADRILLIEVHCTERLVYASCQWLPKMEFMMNSILAQRPLMVTMCSANLKGKIVFWRGAAKMFPQSFEIPAGDTFPKQHVTKSRPFMTLPLPCTREHLQYMVFRVTTELGLPFPSSRGIAPSEPLDQKPPMGPAPHATLQPPSYIAIPGVPVTPTSTHTLTRTPEVDPLAASPTQQSLNHNPTMPAAASSTEPETPASTLDQPPVPNPTPLADTPEAPRARQPIRMVIKLNQTAKLTLMAEKNKMKKKETKKSGK